MKNWKINLSFFTLLLAVVLSAFTVKQPSAANATSTDPYWELIDPSYDVTEPSSYQLFEGQPSCEGEEALCVIQAPNNSGQPNISAVSGLASELQNFKDTGNPGTSGAAFYRPE